MSANPLPPKFYKISVVMQVYLGDYQGSRQYAREKFVRAINSFLAQSYPNKELVIVSDGCVFAKRIYELIYTSNDKIKFVWVDRNLDRKMYDKSDQKTFYRGYPKAVGCRHATGDIICYLDSDDVMLPDHLFALNCQWSLADDSIRWGSNNLRVINAKLIQMNLPKERTDVFSYRTVDLSAYGIYEDFFVNVVCRYNEIGCATYCLSHRKDIEVEWTDTEGINEDVTFVQALMKKYPTNLRISTPTMVVCHYRNGWDV